MMSRRKALQTLGAGALAASLGSLAGSWAQRGERPNILWIFAEDVCPDLGCYGNKLVRTPNLDRLAAEGVRFTNAFTTAPVCSPSRSAIATGMYQTTIDAHHHRSHRGDEMTLPEQIKLITELFREAGYFTANVKNIAPGVRGTGKTDFNFKLTTKPFDGADWAELKDNQPFYAQVNLRQPHRGGGWSGARERAQQDGCLVDPNKVQLPPYLPDHPVVRDDYAHYLDAIHLLDVNVGVLLRKLEEDGLAENTLVAFIGDNGQCMVRGKQWLYDAGIRVPLIIRWPGKIRPGTVRDDPVSAIDLTVTSLAIAGIEPPEIMHGQVFLGPGAQQREYIFAARDRCDETVECIRCVRTKRYKYIRNYRSDLPYMQPNRYKDTSYPARGILRELHAAGKLTPEQEQFMAPHKPPEELYDVQNDPYEVHNLAESPAHQEILAQLREAHVRWMEQTGDLGLIPEPELVALARKYGSGYAILQQPENRGLLAKLRAVVELGEQGKGALRQLENKLADPVPSVRWWAATGLARLGREAQPAAQALVRALEDTSPGVRVAAARALGLMGAVDKALPVLTKELSNEERVVRHYAALALEELGDAARPALEAIKKATKDSYNCVVRVTERIVSNLGG